MLREYECMLILPAEADEAVVSTAVERITKVIAPDGGSRSRKLDRWGRKRFAYEIAHQNEGYYVVVRFTAEPDRSAGARAGAEAGRRGHPTQDPAAAGAQAPEGKDQAHEECNRFPRLRGGVRRNEGGPLDGERQPDHDRREPHG